MNTCENVGLRAERGRHSRPWDKRLVWLAAVAVCVLVDLAVAAGVVYLWNTFVDISYVRELLTIVVCVLLATFILATHTVQISRAIGMMMSRGERQRGHPPISSQTHR